MSVTFNGTNINQITKLFFNGVSVSKGFFNGVQFFPSLNYLWERITLPTTQLREAPKWHGDGKWIAIQHTTGVTPKTINYYTSDDDGDTWTTHTLPSNYQVQGGRATIASNGNGVIMISNEQVIINGSSLTDRILVSTDNGQTWNQSGYMPPYSASSGSTGAYNLYYADNTFIAWGGGPPSVMRVSVNNGSDWTKILEQGEQQQSGFKTDFLFGKTFSALGSKYSFAKMQNGTIKTAPTDLYPLISNQQGNGFYYDSSTQTFKMLTGLSSGNLVFSGDSYNIPFQLVETSFPSRGLTFDNTGSNLNYFGLSIETIGGVEKYAIGHVTDFDANEYQIESLPQQPNFIYNDSSLIRDWQYGSKENENQTWMLLLKDNYLYRRKHI